ncbi:MAG: recombination protein RecR [Desulfobacterales bacterium C00003060]|nr:recombination protein RecR [Pseudomonadota bacterium]OEU52334.1 MAG: recombination protein RecR [Desulfobacterales bacterium S3730MH5]OEU79205.1 MAG: recombination protein RecR [Desulfobacterales bacterium C00003060]OEU79889.1 MAG: recombination protein RecR [Desulfobacterales bacterium S5133MH4]
MEFYPSSLVRLIKHLSKLPGIGEKTATRLALHILRSSDKNARALCESILEVKDKIRFCSICFGLSETGSCSICLNSNRDRTIVCVVEQPSDLAALEKSGAFKGVYHVLHGALSPMNGIGPDDLRIKELVERVTEGEVKEVALATNTNVEGEATASYLAQVLKRYPVRITRIATGVPVGGDLKYLDEVTLRRAMERRENL